MFLQKKVSQDCPTSPQNTGNQGIASTLIEVPRDIYSMCMVNVGNARGIYLSDTVLEVSVELEIPLVTKPQVLGAPLCLY